MRKHRLFVIFLLFISSCGDKNTYFICNNKYKYWKISNATIRGQIYYYFDIKGKWLIFERFPNGKFEPYNGGDVYFINKWSIKNNVINIGSDSFHITNSNNNLIEMTRINGEEKLIMTNSDTFKIPNVYKKFI